MWAKNYFPQNFFPQNYWPTFGSGTPTPPVATDILQVGGDGISMLNDTTFVTLTLSFVFGVSRRTE